MASSAATMPASPPAPSNGAALGPPASERHGAEHVAPVQGSGEARPRILVVDDEATARKALELALRNAGFDPTCVGSPREAIARARAHPPDAVVLDLVMPDLDGYDVLSSFHQLDSTREVPVVVLSGKILTGAEERFLRSLAEAVIPKGPGRLAEVLRTLEARLGPGMP
jgi:CheY-like chemotaxis protein